MNPIILASQSPRRKQLLEWAEIPFTIVIKSTDETYPADLAKEDVPVFIAKEKARVIINHLQATAQHELLARPVLAADTVVVLGNEILGKPKDRTDAIAILTKLSGKKHAVITGVVINYLEQEIAFADVTHVSFHELTQAQIEFYVDKYQPYDKAGAYAIQEWIGVVGIQTIEGDFYNVMGLPVSRVVKALESLHH